MTYTTDGSYANDMARPRRVDTTSPAMSTSVEEGGYKADQGKVRLELIAPEFIFGTGEVLTFGAQKYSDRNWEQGMHWSRPFGAAMRHMWAWWGGKTPTSENYLFGDLDGETKLSHLKHASCCIMFLMAYEARGMNQFDDRFAGPRDGG